VQYEKLGLAEFACKYVRGFLSGGSYDGIALELNTYELDARFAGVHTKAFSVSDEVQMWVRGKGFNISAVVRVQDNKQGERNG